MIGNLGAAKLQITTNFNPSTCSSRIVKHGCVVSMESHACLMLSAKHPNNAIWSLFASWTGNPVL